MDIEQVYHTLQISLAFGMYVIIPAMIIYKMFRRKKLPNNEYTPYDDMLSGRVSFDRQKISEDNKHQVRYAEIEHENHENK
ncbi:hypothetical protein ACSVDE_13945 [Pseudalkalibacillus sp. Hm43]|uniref:hypothetical protein n=1 Tax=Pseudalkalibacillus sp. Hm43 TaxID=3450742 RepID=UPI003F4325C8